MVDPPRQGKSCVLFLMISNRICYVNNISIRMLPELERGRIRGNEGIKA